MIIVKYFIFTFPSFLMQVAGKQLEYNGHQKQRFFAFSSYRELPGQSERQNSCLIGVSLKEGLELRLAGGAKVFLYPSEDYTAPEHTVPAYKLAMEQRVDFVEPDLAVSKDNVLFCMHDDTLERTTNVAEVFPDRASTNYQTRQPGKHWVGNDFTMAEIKRLDAGKWFKPEFAGQRIQTFQDAIDLAYPSTPSASETESTTGSSLESDETAFFDSGSLMVTCGWIFLKVVVTMTKMSRMAKISMSDTMMTCGVRRWRA